MRKDRLVMLLGAISFVSTAICLTVCIVALFHKGDVVFEAMVVSMIVSIVSYAAMQIIGSVHIDVHHE